jgi:hypothetical protein
MTENFIDLYLRIRVDRDLLGELDTDQLVQALAPGAKVHLRSVIDDYKAGRP